jgi:PAS domain S-box-containing protein
MSKALWKHSIFSGYIGRLLILALLYFATAYYGLTFNAVSGFATLVWPPTGLAIAALFIFGFELWPALALGAFAVNLYQGAPIGAALGIALGNTLEAVVAVYLLRHLAGARVSLVRLRDVLGFIFFAALLSTIVSATIGVVSLLLAGTITALAISKTWMAWWLGDMLGALIVAPFLISLFDRRLIEHYQRPRRLLEAILLIVACALASWVIFFGKFGIGIEDASITYLIFPFLIYAALRFEIVGAATASLVVSVMSIWGTVMGTGPFIVGDAVHHLILLQMFMASTSAATLILSAVFTERNMISNEFREQKNKLEALLESMGEGVIATDTRGILVLFNKAAESMLQTRREGAIGRRYDEVLQIEDEGGKHINPLERPIMQALKAGSTFRTTTTSMPTYYYVRKDGSRFPIALTVSPTFLDNKIVGAIGAFRDITFEKEIDQAKSEFISIASHQLRTPLSTMKWYADAVLSGDGGGPLNETQKHYVGQIYESNERMIELLNGLLNVFQVELGHFSTPTIPLDLALLTDEVLELMAIQLRTKEISVRKKYEAGAPAVRITKKDGEIILENLILNAIKYSPKGSTVTITIEPKGKGTSFSVADHGCGIPEAERKNMFSKFFRASNGRTLDPNGSGLGLYITKSIVSHFGGSINYKSTLNQGTTFYVTLPVYSL